MTHTTRKGGAWLLEDGDPNGILTPETLSDEQRLIAKTTDEFMDQEVLPHVDRFERKDWSLVRDLIRRCGELGLLGINVPDTYGGLALDKTASLIVAERVSRSPSFAVAFGAQANLCIVPITLFGTEHQKRTYLPPLVAGTTVGAYALSETGSGSDALAAKTRATQQPDGRWVLNGEKMWITNGGFADVVIVFAQANGDQFTAFIVERAFGGVSSGTEERKMGLHGSSTTSVLLQDVAVPAQNVLGEVGKGHKVALNTLNFGRLKLGAMCVGGCRAAIGDAARYAQQRRQFGRPIGSFGAIKHKLGEMIARTYAAESLTYRTSGLIDAALEGAADASGIAAAEAFEEFAIEASMAKVMGSEVLDYVLDENVQIHGGNGFVADYDAERYYRDARVNRIFEGTNEINRLLIAGMLARRAAKGALPLIPAALRLQDEITSSFSLETDPHEPLGMDTHVAGMMKKVALLVLGTAMQTYGPRLHDEQEVLGYTADILIDAYAAESAVLRARRARRIGSAHADDHDAAARVFVNDAVLRADMNARSALGAMAEGDTLRTALAALRRLVKGMPINSIALRRQLADSALAAGRYILNS